MSKKNHNNNGKTISFKNEMNYRDSHIEENEELATNFDHSIDSMYNNNGNKLVINIDHL